MVTIIKRHIDANFTTSEQESLPLGVLANDTDEVVIRQVSVNSLRLPPEVRELIDVWSEIIHLVASDGDIGRTRIVWTHFDSVNHRPTQVVRCDFVPAFAIISGDMDQAIVTAHPNRAAFMRRCGNGQNGAIKFCADILGSNRPAIQTLFVFFILGKIRANFFERHSTVRSSQQFLCTVIDNAWILR